ncbi:hypothetical protein IF1G_04629 [Cordyceps javanica]|uniref:Uncharacterized protein n=1 Tax=Cordyceps javanica TaxID=43265 RepID=A0A545V2V0_9HYPO|nr:hypothetical protein IF1G_04629 [Cordyceps javanica]
MATSAPCNRAVTTDAAPGSAVLDSITHLNSEGTPTLYAGSHRLRGNEAGKDSDERNR